MITDIAITTTPLPAVLTSILLFDFSTHFALRNIPLHLRKETNQ